jgi:hypothetical protein
LTALAAVWVLSPRLVGTSVSSAHGLVTTSVVATVVVGLYAEWWLARRVCAAAEAGG